MRDTRFSPADRPRFTSRQIANIKEAIEMWQTVPPENVYLGLVGWMDRITRLGPTCKTLACFGGWCAYWPAFQQQGVVPVFGRPTMPSPDGHWVRGAVETAEHLFGDRQLFNSRGHHPTDLDHRATMTDHEIVMCRLRALLKQATANTCNMTTTTLRAAYRASLLHLREWNPTAHGEWDAHCEWAVNNAAALVRRGLTMPQAAQVTWAVLSADSPVYLDWQDYIGPAMAGWLSMADEGPDQSGLVSELRRGLTPAGWFVFRDRG